MKSSPWREVWGGCSWRWGAFCWLLHWAWEIIWWPSFGIGSCYNPQNPSRTNWVCRWKKYKVLVTVYENKSPNAGNQSNDPCLQGSHNDCAPRCHSYPTLCKIAAWSLLIHCTVARFILIELRPLHSSYGMAQKKRQSCKPQRRTNSWRLSLGVVSAYHVITAENWVSYKSRITLRLILTP